jgi:putative transposase
MRQVGRSLTLADEWSHRVVICDRDAKWTNRVREQLREVGVQIVRTPYHAPNANAHAERFVRSIKEECLNGIVPLGERHFQRTVAEYVEHYRRERNHQGLANELIDPVANQRAGRACRRPRLGGLLNYYARAA